MTLPFPIADSQVDAKSPVDDQLAQAIKEDLEDLDSRVGQLKNFDYSFRVNGKLTGLALPKRRVDGILISNAQAITQVRVYLEKPGNAGSLQFDLRKYTVLNAYITELAYKYSDSINSITQIAPAKATQSITRSTSQIATQSISRWKTSLNVQSIILLGGGLVRYNLNTAPDSDWDIGDSVTFASCTNGANNGQFTIVRVNDDGYPSIIVSNGSGVAQTGAAGTADLDAWKYVYTNPVSSEFVAGEKAAFASHTNAANDGNLEIYAINQGGNNIIVKNASGVAQAGVAGNANVLRWVFTFTTAADSDFVVGESARTASHSNAANDGDFEIVAVNSGGNNVVLYNEAGVAQGGVAGTVNTLRWIFALPTDPSSSFSAGHTARMANTSNANNSGNFEVKQVNRLGTNNIVIYNTAGVAQVGAAGTLSHAHMLVKFGSDQSAVITTASQIWLTGMASAFNSDVFDVLEVNRGGGANFNAVINNPTGSIQASPAGRVSLESKSLFSSAPKTIAAPTNSYDQDMQETLYTGVFSAVATLVSGDAVGLEILDIPSGGAENLIVELG